MFGQAELEEILELTEKVQDKLEELELQNDKLDETAEDTLNDGWDDVTRTVAVMSYRLAQARMRLGEMDASLFAIGEQLNKLARKEHLDTELS